MSRLDSILDYKKNNPGCDPNLYEMVEAADEMATRLRKEAPNYGIHTDNKDTYLKDKNGNSTELATDIAKLNEVYRINMEALLNNDLGITKDSPLYKMMLKVKCNQDTYSNSPSYYSKLAAVALYIEQQRRAVRRGEQEKVVYDNSEEIAYLRKEMSPAYRMMLHRGELKSETYPEFEVYKEVFSTYMKSVSHAEHDYDLLAEDWKIYFQLEKREGEKNGFLSGLQAQVKHGEDTKLIEVPGEDTKLIEVPEDNSKNTGDLEL